MKISQVSKYLFFLIASLPVGSCKDEKSKTNEFEEDITHEVSIVEKKEVTNQLTIPGELEGYFETSILAKVSGYVTRILVDIGDRVTKGQLLVELEAPELTSQLIGAFSESKSREAIYLNTKGKFARLIQTNQTPGAVSPYDMDLAKTEIVSDSLLYLAAKAKYESVKSLVAYLRITAPFDGIITERQMAPGAFVGPEEKTKLPILKLISEGKLRLHIAIPEKHLAEVGEGDVISFTVRTFPNKTFGGKITRLSRSLNMQTRSEIVEIEVDNQAGQLLPGMYAIANIPVKRQEFSFVVPQSSVITNMERCFVIKIVKQNRASLIDVQKGELQGDNVEIFGNLNPGDTLVNAASDEIRNGDTLKVILVGNKPPG